MPPTKVRSTVMPSITGKMRREGCRYGVRSTAAPTSGGVLTVQGWDQRKFILFRGSEREPVVTTSCNNCGCIGRWNTKQGVKHAVNPESLGCGHPMARYC